jgi:hypothetical protein
MKKTTNSVEQATVESVEPGAAAAEQGADNLAATMRQVRKLRTSIKAGPTARSGWTHL